MDAAENDDTFTHGCASTRKNPGVVGIENPQKTSHADPPEDAHRVVVLVQRLQAAEQIHRAKEGEVLHADDVDALLESCALA